MNADAGASNETYLTAQLKTWPALRIDIATLACTRLPGGERLQLPHAACVSVLAKAAKGAPRSALVSMAAAALEHKEADGAALVAALEEAELLIDISAAPDMSALEHWVKRGWLDALMLHCSSRDLAYADANAEGDAKANDALAKLIAAEGPPELWTTYSGRQKIAMPPPAPDPAEPFEQVLLRRRSNKQWRGKGVTLPVLSAILKDANHQSYRVRAEAEAQLDTNPAALLNSSFTALESYVVAFNVDELAAGLYHYDLKDHALTLLREGDLSDEYVRACIGQSRPRGAAFAIMLSIVWPRFMYRYRHPRAYRTLLTNVSELAHKYILLGTSFELSSFLTPAFEDNLAEAFLGVDGRTESPIYTVALG